MGAASSCRGGVERGVAVRCLLLVTALATGVVVANESDGRRRRARDDKERNA